MKKVFKSLMVGALVIPCALLCTACGGDNSVKVDTTGDWKLIDKTSAYNEVSNLTSEDLNFDGLRFTIKEEMEGQGQKATITMNGMALYNGQDIDFKIDMSVSAAGKSETAHMYLTENTMYVNAGQYKYKIDMNSTQNPYDKYLQLVPDAEFVTGAIEQMQNAILDSKKSEVDGVTKYYFKLDGNEMSDAANMTLEEWIVLKDGKFDSFKMLTLGSMQGINVKIAMDMEKYTGTIDFPSFNGYTDFASIIG